MANASVPLARVRGFSLELAGKQILCDVSLEVAEGEYVSIVGPNGGRADTSLSLKSFARNTLSTP